MMTREETHESRWGFHPCDRETYEMLRRCNFLRLEAWHQDNKYERWARKAPQNRRRREVVINDQGQRCGYRTFELIAEPSTEHRDLDIRDIHANYLKAKYPEA